MKRVILIVGFAVAVLTASAQSPDAIQTKDSVATLSAVAASETSTLATGSVAAPADAALAEVKPKGSETILEKDPVGIYVTIVSVIVVLISLIALFLLIQLFANIMVRSARKKASKSKAKSVVIDDIKISVPVGCDSVVNGEIIAAIALAVTLNRDEIHDHESDVITINKVARVYSPWSSKIHGLTPMPEHIRK